MKKKLLTLLALLPLLAWGQTIRPISWNIEAGLNVRGSDRSNLPRARATNGYAYGCCDMGWGIIYSMDHIDQEEGYYVGNMRNFHIGVKPEFALTNILSACAGLRLTGTHSNFNPDSHFYWFLEERGVHTHYAMLDRIRQHSAWVGIPVEIRFMPFGVREKGLYLRAGVCPDLRLYTHNYVDFWDEQMEDYYEDRVKDQLSSPTRFTLPMYGGLGLQFGDLRQCCIELTTTFLRHNQKTSLIRPDKADFGMKFTYRIPTHNSL